MSSITGISSNTAYSYSQTAASSSTQPVVAKNSDIGLASSAVSLSTAYGVVSSLAGSASIASASSMLNAIVGAGKDTTATSGTIDPSVTQNQAVLNSLSSTTASSGIYSASGVLDSLPSGWSDILSADPGLAAQAANSSLDMSITGLLVSTSA